MGETSFRHGEDILEEFIFFGEKQGLEGIQDMLGKYKVITLCGSTRFKDDFMRMQKALTLQGNIVISVGCFGHSGDKITNEQKIMLDDMHKRKIDMADEIYVINHGGYIGESTRSEIDYARKHGKIVHFMQQC